MKNEIRKPHKKSTGTLKIIILAVFAALLTVALVSALYVVLYEPNVENGDLPFDTAVTKAPEISSAAPSGDVTTEAAPVIHDVYVRKEKCYNFLVLGRDTVGLNTDVIMVASYDLEKNSISIMQIPRDGYLEVDGVGHKINEVYAVMYTRAYRKGEKDASARGMQAFCTALEKGLSIKLDYYVLLNLSGFREIVDTMGGVDIEVPCDMDYEDPEQDLYIHLKAGRQTLDGDGAEQFIRYRKGYIQADIGRIDAQKIFMSAFLQSMKKNLTLSMIPSLADSIFKNLKTSLSLADMVFFAKNAFGADLSDIHMVTLPGEAIRSGTNLGWCYIPYRTAALSMLNTHFNVYKTDVTDELFDSTLAMVCEDDEAMMKIYTKNVSDDDYYKTADDINSTGIDIDTW